MDHAGGIVVLHFHTVEPGFDGQRVRVGDFIPRHQPGAKAAGRWPVFAGGKPGVLPVAGRAVHIAAVTGNVLQRPLDGNIAPAFADHQRQLAFIIKLMAGSRFNDLAQMPALGIRETDKQRRIGILLVKLQPFGLVVHPDAEDLLWVGDQRQKFDLIKGIVDRHMRQHFCRDIVHCRQKGFQRRILQKMPG
ncbi:hypothetical protein SB6408_05841 [Klebsiella spallanzanii]|uniref:Uncharacterized protein n=1 Tax=Klebsiella spallanzanii TaxID=2587528 RepID=A0A564MIH4_9ENTR|nr:hypothetical protein SB6408_05841 [Klebsiella spallanzanii]